jgi:hypothetical protein
MDIGKAIARAVHEARLAYEFNAGSYTMAALAAVLAVEQHMRLRERPDWIAEFLNYREDP